MSEQTAGAQYLHDRRTVEGLKCHKHWGVSATSSGRGVEIRAHSGADRVMSHHCEHDRD